MLIHPLRDVSAQDLPRVGGKAANLGELLRAGFIVPDGFVLTTDAYMLAARTAGVDPAQASLAAEQLRSVAIPEVIVAAALDAYHALGAGPVAVRSSATAEDLPGASFAGQQDSYLGVNGDTALLDAIRRCWASLWNERAVAYRAANRIDNGAVALAVVVQRMVDARSAGVLFTADPLTGKRQCTAIDAIAGLGEALVSGHVNPDHYAVDTASLDIVERRIIGATAVLDDTRVRKLATVGAAVERHFGTPQDIEFAIDRSHKLWLVQSRPITTLYPLPKRATEPGAPFGVYFSFNVGQGYFEPLTPMGLQAIRLIGAGFAAAFGRPVEDPPAGPRVMVDAGMRLYIDVTPVLRSALGRALLLRGAAVAETRSVSIFRSLTSDPRLAADTGSPVPDVFTLAPRLIHIGVPRNVLRLIARPDATRDRFVRKLEALAHAPPPPAMSPAAALNAFEDLFVTTPPKIMPLLFGMVVSGAVSYAFVWKLFSGRASDDELSNLTRSLAHNPTTEMDLALWALATQLRHDPPSRTALLERTSEDLSAAFRAGTAPAALQNGLSEFLERYGHRAIGEIDLGVPRWADDPSHLLGALANYLRLDGQTTGPDKQFALGARQADDIVQSLIARSSGPRKILARAALQRVRALMGTREMPKYYVVRLLLARGRALLRPVGEQLVAQGRLRRADDVYFLDLAEARRAVGGHDVRELVAAHRAEYERERMRRHVPRVLLSDGTDAEAALVQPDSGSGLRGSPASPGTVTGVARVIRSPNGARLEPGEILVAPSTDPGWTPLFLTAGGLVMEMGGMMSHGAVVAREYGIPAVVGVTGATDRIASGQRITVDGSSGTVTLDGVEA